MTMNQSPDPSRPTTAARDPAAADPAGPARDGASARPADDPAPDLLPRAFTPPGRGGARALHARVADWLRRHIESGAWPPDTRLPAEGELARSLGVSRGTLRAALAALERQGLLVRVQGRGTFVASNQTAWEMPLRLVSLAEALSEQGVRFRTVVLEHAVRAAPPDVARHLHLPANAPVLLLRRLRLVGDAPAVLLHNWVALDRCPGAERADYTRERLFDVIEARCGRLEWGERLFAARRAGPEVAPLLGVAADAPILYMWQVTYLPDGQPVECSDGWCHGERIQIVTTMRR